MNTFDTAAGEQQGQQEPVREPARRSAAGKAVVITASVLGGLALLGVALSATIAAVGSTSERGPVSYSERTAGVETLDVEVSGGELQIDFADVDEARLDVTSSRGEWRLERTGDELLVRSPRVPFGWSTWCFGWCVDDLETATLTLPAELQGSGLDASLDLAAGSLSVEGAFRDLSLDLGAGAMTVGGEARELTVNVSAGRLTTDLAGVGSAGFDVSAGEVVGMLTGSAPSAIAIDVSAGRLDLTLPDDTYRVNTDVSAGRVDNQLRTASSSGHVVEADVSAGSVTLRPAE